VVPVRQAVRALIVDSSSRVLLFRADLPDRPPWWYAPGGGVEAGETDEQALVREVAEETGLVVDVDTLLPPVWARDYIFRWKDKDERHLERFFLIRIVEHAVDISGLDADEAAVVREYRWWALGDMAPLASCFHRGGSPSCSSHCCKGDSRKSRSRSASRLRRTSQPGFALHFANVRRGRSLRAGRFLKPGSVDELRVSNHFVHGPVLPPIQLEIVVVVAGLG
jgi:8-oxo-dGTP pyrophosphatase MutT (NUDIX family)